MGLRKTYANERGASILLALAVVLVCTVVAAVVLVAAGANAGKSAAAQERARSYYAVASAAQLLADDIASADVEGNAMTSVRTYACQDAHPSYEHYDAGVVSEKEVLFTVSGYGPQSPFVMMLEDAMNLIDPTDPDGSYENDFTIHAPDMADVEAHMVVDAEYNITVNLQSVAQTEGGIVHALVLHVPSVRSEPIERTDVEKTDAHMDGWEYSEEGAGLPERTPTTLNPITGSYEPLSNEYGNAVEQLYDVTTSSTTTHITWGEGTIEKGVA